MKKIALFTILSIFAITNQLQAQEPTKQETIDWIVSKFKAYGGSASFSQGGKFVDNGQPWYEIYEYSKVEVVSGSIVKYTCENVKSNTSSSDEESVMFLDISEINEAEIYEKDGIKSIAINNTSL